MFLRNENRNEGTFGCSPGTRTRNEGTFACSPPVQKPERGYIRQSHPFTKPPFYLPVICFLRKGLWRRWPPRGPKTPCGPVALHSSFKIPPDTKYYENNSLRSIFRNFWGVLHPRNLQERRTFSRNYVWNLQFIKNSYFRIIFRK